LTEGPEQRRRIVNESVDTGELLEEIHTDCDRRPAPILLLEQIKPTVRLQLPALNSRIRPFFHKALKNDLRKDALVFGLHTLICRWEVPEFYQAGQAFLATAHECKPSGGIREYVDADAQECGTYHLEAEGKSESNVAF
jgi:hypothetical protein